TYQGNILFFRNTAAVGSSAPAYASASTNPFGISDVGYAASPAFADADADGDVDLFVGTRQGTVLFFRNTAATPVVPVRSTSAPGNYGLGSVILLTLQFSEPVFVNPSNGTPTLQLETGSQDRWATYSHGSGTDTLSFQYIVQAGDSSADLDQLSSTALQLNGGTIRDAAGNNAILTLASPGAPGSLAFQAQLLIDGVAPTGSLDFSIATDTGETPTISSGGFSSDNTLGLSGRYADDHGVISVEIYDGSTKLGDAVLIDGAWSYITPALANGLHSFTARLTDLVGNQTITAPPCTATVIVSATTIDGVSLFSTDQGYALFTGSGAPLPVTYPGGNASATNPGRGWSALAARATATGFALYWGNSGLGQSARWELDASGAYTSGSLLSPEQLLSEEAQLQLDLNGDGYTAGPRTIQGLNLGRTSQGYALDTGGVAPLQVTYPGGIASPSNPGDGWGAVAATPLASGYNLYWYNSDRGLAARWNLDSSGAYTSGYWLFAAQLQREEANLQLDLNGDGYISGPRTIQGVNLGSTSQGYALVTGSGTPVQVTYPGGNASPTNPGQGWIASAAAPTDSGFSLYWSNPGSGQAARWELDSGGVYQSGLLLSASQLIAEELAITADLNGDSIIGPATTTLENQGNASLLRHRDGNAAVQVGREIYSVVSPFGLGPGDASTEWQMLAAETVGDQNQILWRNNPGDFLHLWTLNSSWSWQSSYGAINPSSVAALGLETSFQLDLNGDGLLG
ncbi:MAG: Ig-like domain-containing protein, partial [Synechococcaceae cyanobacterium]|nr:Ig-like domain-containing protein [Synechococcaceae cyanobacterium]